MRQGETNVGWKAHPGCNDPTIGSYNNYHLSPNGIPRGSERWYGLVYLVYKNAGALKGKA